VTCELVAFETLAWLEEERTLIFELIHDKSHTLEKLSRASVTLGDAYARAVLEFLSKHSISTSDVAAIAMHGQTIFHEPQVCTWQIGEPAVVAAKTSITVLADFRVADVANGGQGAPLTSTFDWMLLRQVTSASTNEAASGLGWRAVQNIGGIGNVTFLPPIVDAAEDDLAPIAFDTGPGNVFIDYAASKCDSQVQYDVDGKMGAAGTINEVLLEQLMNDPYIRQPPPKTTGRELYSRDAFEGWQQRATELGMSAQDLVATMTEFTAASIAEAYRVYGPSVGVTQVVVGGGGTRNPFLMQRLTEQLQQRLRQGEVGDGGSDSAGDSAAVPPVPPVPPQAAPVDVLTHEDLGIDSDAKEAMAFALLGYLCFTGMHGNVPACTGASRPCVLGKIVPGANYARTVLNAVKAE
jgi:anhydro-N-acetylmuramic acid kinase